MTSRSKKERSATASPIHTHPKNRIKADNPPEEGELSDFTKWCAMGIAVLSFCIGINSRSFLVGIGTCFGGLVWLVLVDICLKTLIAWWRAYAERAFYGVLAFGRNGAVWIFRSLRWTLVFIIGTVYRYSGVPGLVFLFGALTLGVFQQIAVWYGNGWDLLGELALDCFIPVLWPFLLLWDVFMGIAHPLLSGGIAMVQGTLTILLWSPVTVFEAVFWE